MTDPSQDLIDLSNNIITLTNMYNNINISQELTDLSNNIAALTNKASDIKYIFDKLAEIKTKIN